MFVTGVICGAVGLFVIEAIVVLWLIRAAHPNAIPRSKE